MRMSQQAAFRYSAGTFGHALAFLLLLPMVGQNAYVGLALVLVSASTLKLVRILGIPSVI